MTCPVCSMVNPEGSRSCMRCGTALPESSGGFGQPTAPSSGQQPASGQPADPQPPAVGPGPTYAGPGSPAGPGSGQQPGFSPFEPSPPPPASPFGGPPSGSQPSGPQPAAPYGGHPSGPQPATPPPGYGGYSSGPQPAAPPYGGGFPPGQQSPTPPPFGGYQAGQQPGYGQQPAGGYDWGQGGQPGQGQQAFGGYQAGQQPGYGGFESSAQATQAFPQQQQQYGQGGYADQYAPATGQQYGYEAQPAWQAPPAKSPRRGLWIGIAAFAVVAVVAAVILLVLPNTRVVGKKVLDANAMNTDIAQQYKDRFTQQVTVNCPKDQPAKAGTTFTCSLEGASGRIEVTVQNDNGDYTWRITG